MAIRLYTLAKELRIDSKALVKMCAEAGIAGKPSAMSTLTSDEADRLRAFLASGSTAGVIDASPTEAAAIPTPSDPHLSTSISYGIERTPAFHYAIRDHRRKALDGLAQLCSDRDAALHELETLLKQHSDVSAAVAREFVASRKQIESQHQNAMADRQRLDDETANARAALKELDAAIARHAAHDFNDAERNAISDQANTACKTFANSAKETDRQLDELKKTLEEKQGQFDRHSNTLAAARKEMEVLDQDVSTDSLRAAISAAEEAARKKHADLVDAETAALASLEQAVKEYAARAKTAAREELLGEESLRSAGKTNLGGMAGVLDNRLRDESTQCCTPAILGGGETGGGESKTDCGPHADIRRARPPCSGASFGSIGSPQEVRR